MIRTFNEQYPSLQEKQADFRKALVSMVNARRYLESEGFRDGPIKDASQRDRVINGKIIRSDGTEINNEDFLNSLNKTALLEKMASQEVAFERTSSHNLSYFPQYGMVRSFLVSRNYYTVLSVEDTTKYWFSKRKFAFNYKISLVKDLIENPDNEEFERYIEGLREASRKDTLTKQGSTPITPANNPLPSHLPSSLVDPWSIDIPKIEHIAHKRSIEER